MTKVCFKAKLRYNSFFSSETNSDFDNEQEEMGIEECEILMDNSDVPVEGEIGESNDKGEMGESNDVPVEGEMGESNVVPVEGEMGESNDKGEMVESNDENDESQNIDENDDRVGSMCLHQENETETVCEGFENDVDNEELLL